MCIVLLFCDAFFSLFRFVSPHFCIDREQTPKSVSKVKLTAQLFCFGFGFGLVVWDLNNWALRSIKIYSFSLVFSSVHISLTQ